VITLAIKWTDLQTRARVQMTNGTHSPLTPVEIAARREALGQAEHSGEEEALGRINVDELVARRRARYGHDPAQGSRLGLVE